MMLTHSHGFGGLSVDNITQAKEFYTKTLGLKATDDAMGFVHLQLEGGGEVMLYPKDDHTPATYTVLYFPVDDIDKAVDGLVAKGVKFEHYKDMTDEKGIARGIAANQGPDIAWFKDPAGNIIAILNDGR